jgi:hypothetical protein
VRHACEIDPRFANPYALCGPPPFSPGGDAYRKGRGRSRRTRCTVVRFSRCVPLILDRRTLVSRPSLCSAVFPSLAGWSASVAKGAPRPSVSSHPGSAVASSRCMGRQAVTECRMQRPPPRVEICNSRGCDIVGPGPCPVRLTCP